jgi:hypothetical protein
MTCTIKLKPSLQEFVRCAYLGGGNRVSASDTFGKLIKPWLSLPTRGSDVMPMANQEASQDSFTFELPRYSDKNTDYNFYISPRGQAYIATMLDAMFRMQLNIHLDSILPRCPSLQVKQAIYDYCYSYGLSLEHISYESLKKSYYRYRSEKKIKKKSSGFVPVLSLL